MKRCTRFYQIIRNKAAACALQPGIANTSATTQAGSLTDSEPSWIAIIRPSNIHRALLITLTLLALLAVIITPINPVIKIVVSAGILIACAYQLRALSVTRQLSVHDPNKNRANSAADYEKHKQTPVWTMATGNGDHPVQGVLIQRGYRSTILLILVVQSANSQWHRIPIWVDAVSGSQFSFLHYQLIFNTQTPQPRTFRAVLHSLL
ncbi:MAG: hypothetical protein KTR32_08955 [Granulosicoccus sp.]|nr:hypothetical protein [Granulosicoccus sp.]